MRIHSLEHESFEGLGNIEVWAKIKGHSITRTHLFNNEELPDISEFDWLVIMGGSMNVYEEDKFPWLRERKNLSRKLLQQTRSFLGYVLVPS